MVKITCFIEAHVYLPVEVEMEDCGFEDWKYTESAELVVEAKLRQAFPDWGPANEKEGFLMGGLYGSNIMKIDGETLYEREERLKAIDRDEGGRESD